MKRCQSRRLPGRGDRVLGLLPERAHRSLDALSELRAIFDGLYELAGNPTKSATADDVAQTRRNVRELPRSGIVLHARPTPIRELRTDYETNPPLTEMADQGRSLPDGFSISGWIKWM